MQLKGIPTANTVWECKRKSYMNRYFMWGAMLCTPYLEVILSLRMGPPPSTWRRYFSLEHGRVWNTFILFLLTLGLIFITLDYWHVIYRLLDDIGAHSRREKLHMWWFGGLYLHGPLLSLSTYFMETGPLFWEFITHVFGLGQDASLGSIICTTWVDV